MSIIVTGATGGIGMAVCTHLAKRQEDLMLISRNQDKLAAAQLIYQSKYKASVSIHPGDFSLPETIRALTASLEKQKPTISGVVLIYPGIEKPEHAFPDAETWARNWSPCFIEPLELLRCLTGLMPRGGKLVVVSGIASNQVFPQLALSNAIRSAWLAQVKTLSFALGRGGLRINTVSLGCILTERIKEKIVRTEKQLDPMSIVVQEEKVSALKHHGTPEEAAATICGMLTPFADHLTGTNIICDGGYIRHY